MVDRGWEVNHPALFCKDMKEQIEALLNNWQIGKKDIPKLKELYAQIFDKTIDKCPKCYAKALTELQKYHYLTFEAKPEITVSARRYTLKPGMHELAPGEGAIHSNENTTDRQIEWYIAHYPHTADKLI